MHGFVNNCFLILGRQLNGLMLGRPLLAVIWKLNKIDDAVVFGRPVCGTLSRNYREGKLNVPLLRLTNIK